MRTLFLFCFSVFSILSIAGNRITLIEHFTSAGCGPCAIFNPIADPVYVANKNVSVVIKYQGNIGNVDPMYFENKPESDVRAMYYMPTTYTAPTGVIDGGNVYNSNISAGALDNRIKTAAAVNADWEIDLNYEYVDGYKVKVIMKIKSLIAQTGTLKAHIALLEEIVNYDKAPGTNGEKMFNHVMRKMVPDAYGTALKSSWAANEELTIEEIVVIPSYYKNVRQLAVVGFIQDNATKKVKQAAYVAPQTIENSLDVELKGVNPLSLENLVPVMSVKNGSDQTLTSMTVRAVFPDSTEQTFTWMGNIPAGESQTLTMTGFNLNIPEGATAIKFMLANPNGLIDVNPTNNLFESNYLVKYYSEAETLPVYEDFERTVGQTLYAGALSKSILVDWNKGQTATILWSGSSWNIGANNSVFALLFRNFRNLVNKDFEDFSLPTASFEGIKKPELSYFYSYCPRNQSTSDTLLVQVSVDGGNSWTEVLRKSSVELNTSTNAYTTTESVPRSASEWKKQILSLESYAGKPSVIVRLRNINGNNNTLSLDQLMLKEADQSAIADVQSDMEAFDVYQDIEKIYFTFKLKEENNVTVRLFNMTGEEVKTEKLGNLSPGEHQTSFNKFDLNKGVFFTVLNVGEQTLSRKIVVK